MNWSPNATVEDAVTKSPASKPQKTLMLIAIAAGIVAGFIAAWHIGIVMWGDSSYSEANALWTFDNNGRSRFGNVGNPVMVAMAFAFMFASVPLAGAVAATGRAALYRRANLFSLVVCAGAFLAGYVWWRSYAASMGFPQSHLDSQQIRTGYDALTSPLLMVAATAGALTLAVGAMLRFTYWKHS